MWHGGIGEILGLEAFLPVQSLSFQNQQDTMQVPHQEPVGQHREVAKTLACTQAPSAPKLFPSFSFPVTMGAIKLRYSIYLYATDCSK